MAVSFMLSSFNLINLSSDKIVRPHLSPAIRVTKWTSVSCRSYNG